MDFLNNIGSFLGSDSPLAKLANNAIAGFGAPKPAPVSYTPPAPQIITMPTPATTGMSKGMMIGIGAAVLGLFGILAFTFTRK